MHLSRIIFTLFIAIIAALQVPSPVLSIDDPGFTIARMVICAGISDREPQGITAEYSAETENVFCFLEARNIEFDRTINFVWYFEGQEKARVNLPLQKGRRWRTYSSKKITRLLGSWAVELQDEFGIVLQRVSFRVL